MFRKLLIGFSFICLILIRKYEDIFYDPLLVFFKHISSKKTFPDIDISRHLISVSLRYFLNSALSVSIIYLLFLRRDYMFFSLIFYIFIFFILLPIYAYFTDTHFNKGFTEGFYIRRFLLHPVFLFILIPALIYQKKITEKQFAKIDRL